MTEKKAAEILEALGANRHKDCTVTFRWRHFDEHCKELMMKFNRVEKKKDRGDDERVREGKKNRKRDKS